MEQFSLRLPFEINTVSSGTRQAPIVRPEGSSWHQFIWVVSGSGTFRMRDEEFTLTKGKGIFMRKDVPSSYEGENLYTAWCAFFTTDHLINYAIGEREYLLFDVPRFLADATVELQSLAKGNTTTMALSAAGYSYVTELFSAITSAHGTLSLRVRDYMFSHSAEPLTLDDISAAVGTDRFSLCRKFKTETGKSVMQALLSIRISKAKRMLRYTSEAVERVGRLSGFESTSYFIKRFREAVGATPNEYRKMYLGI